MAKKKSRSQKRVIQLDYLALSFLIIPLFTFFSWGFIGAFLTNLLRLFVGDLYQLFSILFFLYGGYMLFKKTTVLPLNWKQHLGLWLMLLSALIGVSFAAFPVKQQLIADTWQNLSSDLLSNAVLRQTGGGLIGAAIGQLFTFLFSEIGTIVLLVISVLTSVFLLSGKHITDVTQFFSNLSLPQTHSTPNAKPSKVANASQKLKQLIDGSQEETTPSTPVVKNVSNEPVYTTQVEPMVINTFQTDKPVAAVSPVLDDKPVVDEQDDEEMIDEPVQFNRSEDNENYQLPPITLLKQVESADQSSEHELIKRNSKILEDTFQSFGVNARVISANLGPSVTKYEVQPAVGVKVSKIVNLTDDLALALAAKDIRIEAPIPGKSYIGIEVPNQTTSMVSFREIIEGNIHSVSKLEVPLGRDISGNIRMADLSKMPHLLVAGATGSGKSVAVNGMITSILMKAKPSEVKLMMIDPKKVELSVYNGIPHLLTPVVTNPRRAAQALQKAVMEMERRYELFAQTGMKNITGYNEQVDEYNKTAEEPMQKMPYIVVIVDELADLMMVASNEVESAIIRLAQMARAAGIHMVLATQRPSVDVITGLIKANVPSRMAFAVSSSIDSRTIIDGNGAEKLLGKGDMLFMPMGESKPVRVQGAYLSEAEVERIVAFVKDQQEASYNEDMMPSEEDTTANLDDSEDDLFQEVVAFIADQEYMSVSMLQRRFRIGFNRAARLMEDLEKKGFVGAAEGTKPRRVLVPGE